SSCPSSRIKEVIAAISISDRNVNTGICPLPLVRMFLM
ncbi:MAG: hypothetical protein ACJA01_004396, partial [Saprospiraceae bacterium]